MEALNALWVRPRARFFTTPRARRGWTSWPARAKFCSPLDDALLLWKALAGADFWFLAAGALQPLLPETRALERDELEMTQGYFVPQTSDSIPSNSCRTLRVIIWSFPSAIIFRWGFAEACRRYQLGLRSHLQTSWRKHGIQTDGAKFYQSRPALTKGTHAFRTKRHR